MTTIELDTEIAAPVERCFDLSLSIDLHVEGAAGTGEQAIAGVTRGLIGAGEEVTWRGRHFGLTLTHSSRITGYERPGYFQDRMIRGAFASFEHDHFFEPASSGGTLMRDVLRFAAPLGPLGWLAERVFLREYLRRFLVERNGVIRRVAESAEWRRYLGAE